MAQVFLVLRPLHLPLRQISILPQAKFDVLVLVVGRQTLKLKQAQTQQEREDAVVLHNNAAMLRSLGEM